jgi:hypothetical protein
MQTVDTTTTRAQEPQQQQQPDFAPPQQQAPLYPGEGKEKKSRKGLILGVLAAGGVLGILGVLAVLAVGGAIFLFAAGSTSSGEQPADQPVDRPVGEPLSADGSLDGLIQERVGDFALQQSDALPQFVDAGAADAQELLYASPEGVEVVHQMTDWDSPAAADQVFREQTELYASDGYRQAEEFEVTGQEGQQIGSGATLIGSDGEEVVLWSNNDGFYVVIAPEGYGTDFYQNLEY